MIPGITEGIFANGVFQEGWPSYATLHQATVQFEDMCERTISTQVRIDGSIVPEFDGWALKFRDELFVLPTLKPQASKDNSTKNALIDLVFTSAPIHELKRYFFAEMTEIEQGTIIIDKYVASLRLSLTNFVAAFNRVLQYYFPDGSFVMNLNPSYVDTGELIPVLYGEMVGAVISGVNAGQQGEPGELCGYFTETEIGSIERNDITGVYGQAYNVPGQILN